MSGVAACQSHEVFSTENEFPSVFFSMQKRHLPSDEFRLLPTAPGPPSAVPVSGAGRDGKDADSRTTGNRIEKGRLVTLYMQLKSVYFLGGKNLTLLCVRLHIFARHGCRLFKCTVVWSQMKRGPKLM